MNANTDESRDKTEQEAKYGRCILCDTPYVTYRERSGKNGWTIGKECPNPDCSEGR